MQEAPEVSAHGSDSIRKRVPESLYCPMLLLPPVSMTSVVISGTRRCRSPIPSLPSSAPRFILILSSSITTRGAISCQIAYSEITRDGDRLFAQGFAQAIGGPKFELFAESEKNFFVKVTGSQITFETGSEGRATSLIMHRVGREPTPAPRLP